LRPDPWHGHVPAPVGSVDLRVDLATWSRVLADIFDFSARERAGALLVRARPASDPDVLIGLSWMTVPDEYVIATKGGLAYDGRFNLRVAEAAAQSNCGALIVHAHPGDGPPAPSTTDAEYGAAFLDFMRRRRPDAVHGLLVVADDTITGVAVSPLGARRVERLVAAGIPTREWTAARRPPARIAEDDRQLLAIGAHAQARLAGATVAVIGNSGGGSHVTQQLIHAGVGTLVVVDADVASETNLRRLVGQVHADIDVTPKVEIAIRTAKAVRPSVAVEAYAENFPSSDTIRALRRADVIVGCVDGWDARDDLNTFALSHRIPYVDIGAAVARPTDGLGVRVGGQVAVVTPDGACMRCMGLVTDANVDASREGRRGYADDVPEPQVVSINGTLASEAVTATLMLLAGDDRVARYRRYAYPPGKLVEVEASRSQECSSCRSAELGCASDPPPPGPTANTSNPRPAWPRRLLPMVRRIFH